MATGLTRIDGAAYYFGSETGQAKSGWKKIGKSTYYFDRKTFQMVTSSWVKKNGSYYYLKANGKKAGSGWLNVDGEKYYLDTNGARVTGTCYIKGKGYYFKKNGIYDPTVEVKDEVDPSKPMVALTFDDGPGPYTERLLNCLEKNDAKATFFMVGSSVPKYSSTVKRMATLGCELGNHSYSHSQMSTLSDSARKSEVSRTSANIKAAAGSYPTVFRLPYGDGARSSSVLSSLGLPSIYWSIDTRDWANTGNPQHTISAVLDHVKSGDIVLMHDIHKSSVVAAETIIPALKKKGYQLVTVSQLAKYKGKTTLHSGKTYYNFY
jgi:peptidoglycan/xylan/chitin deacetylase (PgdA/CDA1 family)